MKPTRYPGRKVFIATTYVNEDNVTRCPHCGHEFLMKPAFEPELEPFYVNQLSLSNMARMTTLHYLLDGGLAVPRQVKIGEFSEGPLHHEISQCPGCEKFLLAHQLFKALDKSANVC